MEVDLRNDRPFSLPNRRHMVLLLLVVGIRRYLGELDWGKAGGRVSEWLLGLAWLGSPAALSSRVCTEREWAKRVVSGHGCGCCDCLAADLTCSW